MPEPPEILWTGTAKDDLREIVDYIRLDSPKTALRILTDIEDKVSRLRNFPEQGRIIPELSRNNIIHYRELIVSPWRVFYKSEGNKIYIMAVIDGRRNIEDILLNRVIR